MTLESGLGMLSELKELRLVGVKNLEVGVGGVLGEKERK